MTFSLIQLFVESSYSNNSVSLCSVRSVQVPALHNNHELASTPTDDQAFRLKSHNCWKDWVMPSQSPFSLIDDNSKPSKVQHLYSTVLTHYFPPPSMARSDTVTLNLLPLPLFLFRYWTSDTSRALSGCSPSNVDVPQALSTAFFDIMLIVGNRTEKREVGESKENNTDADIGVLVTLAEAE
ncbi:hypothetical protein GYMLUDRAFT_240970 [Collybiopsis luxurians FD-317 M1]|nr:hypothetical protein GYMLUDRAFT_240970 [Collybiopsis luxurians FD-317 M1]